MKIQTTALMLMTGLLALVNLPASAQDKPDKPEAPPASPTPPASPAKPDAPAPPPGPPPSLPRRPQGDMHRVREPERELEKSVAYLGLLTNPVSRELQAQFDLPEGFGLQIVEVMPDSPALAAGLKEHDVLLNFEDQKLVNMEQLQTLVRSKKKGDSVMLTVLSGGQRKPVPVTIGERMIKLSDEERPRGFMPGMPQDGRFFDRRDHGSPEEFREQAEQFQNRLRDYQKRMEEWTREGRRGTMPPPPMFDGPRDGSSPRRSPGGGRYEPEGRRDGDRGDRGPGGPGGAREAEGHRPDGPRDMPQRPEGSSSSSNSSSGVHTRESASITRSDETGLYSLQKSGDQAVFNVTPKGGEAKSWPVGTEEQRAAVPEPYRTKLREMEEIRSSVRRDGGRPQEGRPQETPPPEKRPEGI